MSLRGDPAEKYKLSQKQVDDITDAFKLFDQDGNGVVTPEEVSVILRIMGLSVTDEDLKTMISEVDTKESRYVDFDDWMDMMAKRFQDRRSEEEELKNAFTMFDKECSGLISAEELKVVLTSLQIQLTETHIDDVMKMEDVASMGMLDYAAFAKILRSL